MKSGATETSYHYLAEHYRFPDSVFVHHLPSEIVKSNKYIKILWSHHSYDQPHYVGFDHNICDLIVCPSTWLKEKFIKFHRVPEDKLVVIPNGVSDQFVYNDKKTKTLIHTSIPYKGLELLPAIFPKVLQAHPDCQLKIFSSMSLYGQHHDPYTELYKQLENLPNVHYSPAVDQAELIPHLQSSALFVHPNIWEETSCVSLLEAMRCGCYPVLSDIGALPETSAEIATIVPMIGRPNQKGWLVADQFINNFAQAIIDALDYFTNDRVYYDEISKRCSQHAEENHSWKMIAKQWETTIRDLYEKVGSKHSNKSRSSR
jgi:glycosyltransferase involved in cell wall biosynthesis